MRLVLRLIGLLVICLLIVSVFSSWLQVQRERGQLRDELRRHAELLADTLQQNVERTLATPNAAGLQKIAQRFGGREHLLGVAVYDAQSRSLARTPSLQQSLNAPPALVSKVMQANDAAGEPAKMSGQRVYLYAIPLHHGSDVVGSLLIVHDASYIATATQLIWKDMSVRVVVQICLLAIVVVVMFQRSVLNPLARTTAWMREMRHGRMPAIAVLPESDMLKHLATEASTFAQSLADARASAEREAHLREAGESSWTAQRLAIALRTKLKDSRLFVVSNREPYIHTRQGRTVKATVPASGLVTGLEPILRACDGTWVAHGSGNADRETVDARNCLRVPPEDPKYTLRRVWLTREQEEAYYLGFSNEGLWPLCHIAHTRPTFRARDWEHYKQVNALFAEAVLDEMAGTEEPVVIVQDYHFALLPRLIKQRRPDARVGIFWHIPWPNAEAFGICPWQHELLDGLLGADLIGFHVQAHCDNFLETVNDALECRVEWERFAINRANHTTMVRPFPISVAFPEREQNQAPMHEHQSALLDEIGAEALYIGVGVDRVDYTKGIIERFAGVARFFEKYPQYQGKFTFVQIGAPSRTDIKRYHDFLDEVDAEAEAINRKFGRGNWKPILFRKWHHTHAEVDRFYRAADVCLVTSLHDGMNLVAKEYIVSRQDEDGALVLSPFTGAARELPDALIVNPYDTESVADAIFAALEMEPVERRTRMRRMRAVVKQQNVYRWAGNLIGDLCDVRVGAARSARQRGPGSAAPWEHIPAEPSVYELGNTGAMAASGD